MQEQLPIFVTGIGTDVGKTVISAILVEALEADYWKPVQAGDLDNTDSMKVEALISNSVSTIHPEGYRLNHPMSPHAAAALDGVQIKLPELVLPAYRDRLIVEGAGGLMVPLNEKDLILELIQHLGGEAVLVSRNYLGSINHTLLTAAMLQMHHIPVRGIVFNGPPNPETERIILKQTQLPLIGKVPELSQVDQQTIKHYAAQFKTVLTP